MSAKRGRPTDRIKNNTARLTDQEKMLIDLMRAHGVSTEYAARALDTVMDLAGWPGKVISLEEEIQKVKEGKGE